MHKSEFWTHKLRIHDEVESGSNQGTMFFNGIIVQCEQKKGSNPNPSMNFLVGENLDHPDLTCLHPYKDGYVALIFLKPSMILKKNLKNPQNLKHKQRSTINFLDPTLF